MDDNEGPIQAIQQVRIPHIALPSFNTASATGDPIIYCIPNDGRWTLLAGTYSEGIG